AAPSASPRCIKMTAGSRVVAQPDLLRLRQAQRIANEQMFANLQSAKHPYLLTTGKIQRSDGVLCSRAPPPAERCSPRDHHQHTEFTEQIVIPARTQRFHNGMTSYRSAIKRHNIARGIAVRRTEPECWLRAWAASGDEP